MSTLNADELKGISLSPGTHQTACDEAEDFNAPIQKYAPRIIIEISVGILN